MIRLAMMVCLAACGNPADKDDDDAWDDADSGFDRYANADGGDNPWGGSTTGGTDDGSDATDGSGGGTDSATDGVPDAAGPGDDCETVGVLDCRLECWDSEARDYIGDGTCDTGQRGPDWNCAEVGMDDGDCELGGDTTGGDTTAGDDGATTGVADTAGDGDGVGTPDDPTTGGETDASGGTGDATTGGASDGDGSMGGGVSAHECDVEGPLGYPAPGAFDCRGECVALIYHAFYDELLVAVGLWSNGNCDDAGPHPDPEIETEYADFNCAAFAFDYGDCPRPS